MASFLAILVVYCIINVGVTSPPSCFSCSAITQARYCDFNTQCDEGEVCFVEKIENQNGHFKYTSGCMHNTTCESFFNNDASDRRSSIHEHSVCRECCYGDMCNNKGCGDHGPSNNRGPYCFQCDHLSDPSECDHVTICDINEVCGVVEEIFQHERQFSTGCMRRSECQESLIFGRELNRSVKSTNLCRRCCENDLCNHWCDDHSLDITTQQSKTTPSTSKQSTPLITTTAATPATLYRDCDEYYRAGSVNSGVYTISPDDVNTFDVYCDMEDGDGGWIVLQHRFNGSVLFNRSFSDYENGFGQLDGEFWLGLKKMYILAHSNRKVRFNLQELNGSWLSLEYGDFSISNASLQYTLHVANHTNGLSAISFGFSNGCKFATYDKDTNSCAKDGFSGWWYAKCSHLNINAYYGNEKGVVSHYHLGRDYKFQRTKMMIQ